MKKYRFGDPSKSGFFRKYGNFVYFFTAWNLLGIIVWKSMSKNKSGTEEKWDEMSSTEKYLSLIGFGRGNKDVTLVKIEGLHVETKPEEEN